MKRFVSIITFLSLCLTLLPVQAFAAEDGPDAGLCPHHAAHTDGCGFIAPGGGQPCEYACRLCPIEDLLAALPRRVTADNAESVRGQVDEILSLYRELSVEEQGQLNLTHCVQLQAALDAANAPMTMDEPGDNVANVTIGGETTPYPDINTAWDAASEAETATVTLLTGATIKESLTVTSGQNITLDGGGYTLDYPAETGCAFYIDGGALTLKNCKLTSMSARGAVWAEGGAVDIEGCTITSESERGASGVAVTDASAVVTITDCAVTATCQDFMAYAVNANDGTVNIKSGTFTGIGMLGVGVWCSDSVICNIEGGQFIGIGKTDSSGLVIENQGTSNLSGGTYRGSVNAINLYDTDINLAGLLVEDHAYYKEDDARIPLDTLVDVTTLTDPVTVGKCEHIEPTSNHDGTHNPNCPYCGNDTDVNCTYHFSGNTGTCQDCGDALTVSVSGTEGLTYDGAAKTLEVAVKRGEDEVTAPVYTVDYEDNVDAGTASVTVTIDEEQGTYTQTFEIGRATPTVVWDETVQTRVYTGSPAAVTPPTVTLKNGETFSEAFTYSYTGTASGDGLPTNAGTYTVHASIAAAGNYTNASTETPLALTIEKADAEVTTPPVPKALAYTGEAQALVTAGTADVGDVVYSLTENGTYSAEIPAGINAGTYTVWYKVEDTANYNGTAPIPVTAEIGKAVFEPQAGTLYVRNGYTREYAFDLTSLLPEPEAGQGAEYTLKTVSITADGYYTGGAAVTGNTLTLPVQKVETETEGPIGTVTVTISCLNFETYDADITVSRVNKEPVTITGVTAENTTYNGEPQAGYTGTPASGFPGRYEVTYTGRDGTDYDGLGAPKDAGGYSITIAVPENDTEYSGSITLNFSIAKKQLAWDTSGLTAAKPAGSAEEAAVYGVLGLSGVIDGEVTLTQPAAMKTSGFTAAEAGTYPVSVVTADGSAWGFAPADPANYLLPEGNPAMQATVNPVESTELPPLEDGTVFKLDVETGLSTVPAALAGMEAFNTPEKMETALRAEVEKVLSNAGENFEVFDVTLQYKDESGQWQDVDPENFPADGVTAVLPYPDGTGANPSGYRFTVQHLISSGGKAGTMETLRHTLAENGLECKFTSLSPVAVGYQAITQTTSGSTHRGSGSSGGGYDITIKKASHGTVSASRSTASSGTTVTLTVTPDDGYALDSLTVTDSRGDDIRVTEKNGKFTFTMPARAVTVDARFLRVPEEDGHEASCPSRAFYDLDTSEWYHEAVDFALENGLMSGTSSGFAPGTALSRAMLAQILWNHAGKPAAARNSFPDVPAGEWYTGAVDWAAAQGIISGYSDGRFAPDDSITREQLAVMLWRYEGSPAAGGQLSFTDADSAGSYALDALRWAVGNGILSGKSGNRLDPTGPAARAEAAQMLYQFLK